MTGLTTPSTQQLREELGRVTYRKNYTSTLRRTIWTLVVVAAAAILCSSFFISVLVVHGSSMDPTLQDGQLVLVVKTDSFRPGEIMAFYYNNKILLKRVIGGAGDVVDISADGSVSVNGVELSEPYVQERCMGDGDVTFPFEVPDSRWFVLGDRRATSVDSRWSMIGTVAEEQVIGRVVLRLWPLKVLTLFS